MTPPGSPCSQAKEAWTVFPSESWPRGCWPPSAPRPGWGSPLPPFLELLAAPRAWSRLQLQPQQLSELVSLSCSCTTQKHLLSPHCWDTVREYIFHLFWQIWVRGWLCWPKSRASPRLIFVLWSRRHQLGLTWLHAWLANQLLPPHIHLPGMFHLLSSSPPHAVSKA